MERFRRLRRDLTRTTATDAATARADAPAPGAAAGVPEVQVIYGASVQRLALTGLTVAQARPVVETILAVAPQSPALVNGRRVRENYVIALGDALEFVHHAGEKGRAGWICASRSRRTPSCAAKTESQRFPLR
jgi:hypothetical protein